MSLFYLLAQASKTLPNQKRLLFPLNIHYTLECDDAVVINIGDLLLFTSSSYSFLYMLNVKIGRNSFYRRFIIFRTLMKFILS